MKKNKSVSITIDVDTIDTLFPNLRQMGTNDESFVNGLQKFLELFDKYGVKSTLFVVGKDMLNDENVAILKDFHLKGHEIANHTMNHNQGLRHLSIEDKYDEICDARDLLHEKTGADILGFRAPGWNFDADVLLILAENDYLYDSSMFPTSVMPLAKLIHYRKTRSLGKLQRSTMGPMRYMFAKNMIHNTRILSKRGNRKLYIYEYPLTTTPFLRLPFFGTMVFEYGLSYFDLFYKFIRKMDSVNFSFHLAELTDKETDFNQGVFDTNWNKGYIPKCLYLDIDRKIETLDHVLKTFSNDFDFVTMKDAVYNHDEIRIEKMKTKQGLPA